MDHLPFPVAEEWVETSPLNRVNEQCRLFTEKLQGLDLEADISVLKLPTVGRVNEGRFPLSGEYVYIRRKKIIDSLGAVVAEWVKLGGYKVLYVHHCSYWAADPLTYLREEALSTFYGDSGTQTQIVQATTMYEILQILVDSQVIVVADQVVGLYQKYNIPGQGWVQTQGSLAVLGALSCLSNATLVFMAASAQKTGAFVDCLNKCNKTRLIKVFEGFSPEEFAVFKLHVPAYSGLDDTAVEKLEKLTGFLPGLLSLPGGPEFSISHTPLPVSQSDGWIIPLQGAVVEFVAMCMTNTHDKHKKSHEAAVFGTEYWGDQSLINFDIVSLPDKDGVVVCPSDFCKDLLSDHMAETDLNHKKNRLVSLRADMQKVDQEPTKLGDAAEDYLIAFMEVHKKCPMQIPNTLPALCPKGHIPLMACKKFDGMCPDILELTWDYQMQASPNAMTPSAIAYFPQGKFLRYIDFVLRALIKTKEGEKDLMVLVVGQITLSLPTDHKHTWKFFQTDYLEWQGGYDSDKVETKFVLAWFTPHQMPDLTSFSFAGQPMCGETVNIAFNTFAATDGDLGAVFSPLCNPEYYKCCGCESGSCPKQCGCRKAHIPC